MRMTNAPDAGYFWKKMRCPTAFGNEVLAKELHNFLKEALYEQVTPSVIES
jgi:hypothetical protein